MMTEGQRDKQRRRQSKAKRRRVSLSIKVGAARTLARVKPIDDEIERDTAVPPHA